MKRIEATLHFPTGNKPITMYFSDDDVPDEEILYQLQCELISMIGISWHEFGSTEEKCYENM